MEGEGRIVEWEKALRHWRWPHVTGMQHRRNLYRRLCVLFALRLSNLCPASATLRVFRPRQINHKFTSRRHGFACCSAFPHTSRVHSMQTLPSATNFTFIQAQSGYALVDLWWAKLQTAKTFINCGIRFIHNLRLNRHITPYRRRLGWLTVESRRLYFLGIMTYLLGRTFLGYFVQLPFHNVRRGSLFSVFFRYEISARLSTVTRSSYPFGHAEGTNRSVSLQTQGFILLSVEVVLNCDPASSSLAVRIALDYAINGMSPLIFTHYFLLFYLKILSFDDVLCLCVIFLFHSWELYWRVGVKIRNNEM